MRSVSTKLGQKVPHEKSLKKMMKLPSKTRYCNRDGIKSVS